MGPTVDAALGVFFAFFKRPLSPRPLIPCHESFMNDLARDRRLRFAREVPRKVVIRFQSVIFGSLSATQEVDGFHKQLCGGGLT